MRRTNSLRGVVAAGLLSAAVTGPASGAEIRVGMTTALDGPASALGQGMRDGIEALFARVNAAGGLGGRKLELVALDDGYEPARAAPNMRRLIDEERVVAVIGNVGTPTAIVTVPIANERKTLLFGAFTGAGVLRRSPPDRYVINYRASYAQETASMVNGLLDAGIEPEAIAFFTQEDGYGDSGYQGAVKALEARGFAHAGGLAHGRYKRNTLNVEGALGTVLDARVEPRAVIMVGAYGPCAKFIQLAKADLPSAIFLNVSFVGSIPLRDALGPDAEGVVVTQVVPHFSSELPGVVEYRAALAASRPGVQPGFVSLEGYLVAKTFVAGLAAIRGPVTNESVIDGLESLRDLDIGIGVEVGFSPTRHDASETVWPTVVRDGSFVPLDWRALRAGSAS